jgi:hypothetical protein
MEHVHSEVTERYVSVKCTCYVVECFSELPIFEDCVFLSGDYSFQFALRSEFDGTHWWRLVGLCASH